MAKTVVSVGIPVYNEEKYISDLLRSVSAQDYPLMEVLISDNASTDNTWNIVQEYAAKDQRIKAVRHASNRGGNFNGKYILECATGEYFIMAGGHDLWGDGMISACAKHLDENPNTVLCVPETRWIDHDGNLMDFTRTFIDTTKARGPADRVLTYFRQMDRCSSFYGLHRRKCLLATQPWPEVIGNDLIILLRLAKYGDVVTEKTVFWCRRQNRVERQGDMQRRQIKVLKITGIAAKYPYIISRLVVIREIVTASGDISSRIKLFTYSVWRLFFRPAQFRILLKEFFNV